MDLFEVAVNPNWEEFDQLTKYVHEWRAYIPDGVRAAWFDIPLVGRIAIVEVAQKCADRESWN